jgi:hypothetical protein
MSILLQRILWYPISEATSTGGVITYGSPTDITDAINMNVGKGLDIQNNVLSFDLRNDWQTYVNTEGIIRFEEEDQFKVYAKYVEDNDDITAAWTVDSITYPTSSDLMGIYFLKEYGVQDSNAGTRIKITAVDKTYILFNKVFSKSWTLGNGFSAPELVQKIVRLSTQGSGSFSSGGVNYEIDARLVSEGGNIQDTRKTAPTTFPDIEMAKVWKPIYEWMRELSSTDSINYATEVSGESYVYGIPFIFWVDENNSLHWKEPTSSVSSTFIVGTSDIYKVNLKKKMFGNANMIIYNAGEDMDKRGIWSYYLDETSNIKGLQMKVVPMTHIARDLKNRDYQLGVAQADRNDGGDGAGLPLYQYPAAYGGGLSACVFPNTNLTTYTAPGDITDDNDYNSALKERALYDGRQLAKRITSGLAHLKWKGNIEVKGAKYTVGTLISLTDDRVGLSGEELRVMDVKHNLTRTGWFTTLSIEKDPETLIK